MLPSPYSVLLIDAEPGEHPLIESALQRQFSSYRLRVASTGQQALAALESSRVLPDLVLLAVSLPDQSGFDVLRQLRADPRYGFLPVVIRTTATDPANSTDHHKAYQLRAAACLSRPESDQQLCDLICWLQVNWPGWRRSLTNRVN
jgi:CheY-like chemotaxis protein